MRGRSGQLRMAAAVAGAAGVLCALPGLASAAKVVNGGFETGSLSGWTEQNEAGSAGTWLTYTGTSSPLSGHPIPAPPQGSFAAITDQTDAGSSILYQNVKLARKQRHVLTVVLYYQSYAAIDAPPTLDYTAGPNQQYRVDVMKSSSPAFSMASSDILKNVLATPTAGATQMQPQLITANLSHLAGRTVRLRFAMADNVDYFNAGVDAVMVTSTPLVKAKKATKLKAHKAVLHGTVNPNGGPTQFHFVYGLTKSYGHKTPVKLAGSDSRKHRESALITGLKSGVTYHYRLVAANLAAKSRSKDRTFTTP